MISMGRRVRAPLIASRFATGAWFVISVGLAIGALGCAGGSGFSAPPVVAEASYAALSPVEISARIARGDDSEAARRALRAAGSAGLAAVLAAYDAARASGANADALQRLSVAADTAAQQRDAIHARLYWYTDLEEAERVAQREHKPILSLRMLGHLDDELSCANSRFFRTTLYPDPDVNARLRDRFVLHWSSERPVPIVTIDYGDGRVVRRTITGNSIHYVLDPSGHVVDAIPGLYSATEFAAALDAAHDVASAPAADETERERVVADFQDRAARRTRDRWVEDATAVGFLGAPAGPVAIAPPVPGAPPALMAIPAAASKAMVEMPIARAITLDLPTSTDLDRVPWAKIGARLRPGVRVGDASRALMREKAPLDWSTGTPKPLDDAGFDALVSKFEDHVAEDMARNEYYFHAQIRRWIAADPGVSLTALNERVYRELFLTPASDPWLGLVPPIVYSGIQGDGLAPRR